jgi:hypothetical protein
MRAATMSAVGLALLALAACGGGADGDGATPQPTPTRTAVVAPAATPYQHGCPSGIGNRIWLIPELTVNGARSSTTSVPITFSRGEAITIKLSIGNCSTAVARVHYSSSQRYDFAVADARGREVWRWSSDKLFAQVIAEEEFRSVSYETVWDGRDAAGVELAPGVYTVSGFAAGELRPDEGVAVFGCDDGLCMPQASVEIEIVEPAS